MQCKRGLPCALVLAALTAAAHAKAATPRFKWGQSKELVFLSVMVRDLDQTSVSVALPTEGELQFRARNARGEEFSLDLPLREDVKPDALKWEISPRTDKWGTAVAISLGKQNEHRWDLLVTDPKRFRGAMDKDWAREDQTLEPEEEAPYAEDHAAYLTSLTAKSINGTLAKFSPVIVNVRYPWCSQCKSQDDTFAKAAKLAKAKGKKDKAWKKAAFAVVDAREERGLARWLGAKCDFNCEYQVFTEGEAPVALKSKWSESELLGEVAKFLGPAVRVLGAAEAEAARERNTTCLAGFASDKDPRFVMYKKVASLMRGELVFAATLGEEKAVEIWPHGQNFSFKYDGTWDDNGTALYDWLRPRSIPLLQAYDWQHRETYEKLGLPLAKVWINDEDKNPSFEKIVRHAVRRVAKRYIGKIAFVEQKKSTYSYELRDYGLNQPELYPAFGIASNASYNSVKYGFEITADVAPSVQDFWRDADKAIDSLAAFCDKVLGGTWPEAHESGAPHTNWTRGNVKKLVWKTYKEVQSPDTPLLLEVYGKYRSDNEKRLKEVENLARLLEPHAEALTVASYDAADNHLPQAEFKRDKYSSDTEWFWVPRGGGEASTPTKLMKPKKDAPVRAVLEFVKKQAGMDLDVDKAMQSFEDLMKENPPPTPAPLPPMDGAEGLGGLDSPGGLGDLGDLGNLGGGEEAGEAAAGAREDL